MTTSDKSDDSNVGNDDHDGNNDNTRAEIVTIKIESQQSKKKKKPIITSRRSRILKLLIQGLIHIGCIVLYLIPILTPNEFAGPTLDEAHVMSGEVQKDIHDPNSSFEQIFSNDYWGRPMDSPSSHRSWRPLTILSFRYLKGPYINLATQSIQQLTVHRFVNAILHATVADLVGQLATQLFIFDNDVSSSVLTSTLMSTSTSMSRQSQQLFLQLITKILFCLHPTHVEVTANAANRSHLLAVLLGIILCFPGTGSIGTSSSLKQKQQQEQQQQFVPVFTPITTPFWLFVSVLIAGYLASETFLFMIPGIMVTITVVAFTNNYKLNNKPRTTSTTTAAAVVVVAENTTVAPSSVDSNIDNNNDSVEASQTNSDGDDFDDNDYDNDSASFSLTRFVYEYLLAILSITPRLILLAISVLVYYCGRWYYDTLDIPTGLIRPAESPYYEFEGMHRIRNYLYVVTIHLGKQWGLILPKHFGGDPIGFSHEYGYECVPEIKQWGDDRLSFGVGFHIIFTILSSLVLVLHNPRNYFGLVAIHWSWTIGTLFPICGIVKVGTFISDRIVVPSTVVVSIWTGKIVHTYATDWIWNKSLPFVNFRPLQFILILWWIITSYATVHNRSLEWMDSISLMRSSLITCPRFAKVHMEVSKIYSGLYPTLLDLQKSRYHLDTAREIDPNLCDLHKQYVYVSLQENKYLEVEEELTQALLCPFTMGGTEQLWNNYWNHLLSSAPKGTKQHADIETRYRTALSVVQLGIEKEQELKEEQAAMAEKGKNNY